MQNPWDLRYSEPGYAYGSEPNEYLKAQLHMLPPARILFPAEGEGRNAVYAARLGWDVTAFDQSEAGKTKALSLAEENQVQIRYLTGDFSDTSFQPASFDAIAFIYAHFPGPLKAGFHRMADQWLKPGGYIIFEGFSKEHPSWQALNPGIGGPKEAELLYSVAELEEYYHGYSVHQLQALEVELHEGKYHNGKGHVVRALLQKPEA